MVGPKNTCHSTQRYRQKDKLSCELESEDAYMKSGDGIKNDGGDSSQILDEF